MAKSLIPLLFIILIVSLPVKAEDRYFLGTKTGWARTNETFSEGRYKDYKLFLVIGAKPTTEALKGILGWRSRTTYIEDIKNGGNFFTDQVVESGESIPENFKSLGDNVYFLFSDPVKELKDVDLITPASILLKTTWNILKIGWYSIAVVGEPVARVGAGSIALVGSPFIKPVTYTGIFTLFTCTAVYGYTSSTVCGSVLLSATGVVLPLDIATSPMVATYNVLNKDDPSVSD